MAQILCSLGIKTNPKKVDDDTIDATDYALARANIIRMLHDATSARGGHKFEQIFPPYMDHDESVPRRHGKVCCLFQAFCKCN